jgi:CheY-like chemotaxis protein
MNNTPLQFFLVDDNDIDLAVNAKLIQLSGIPCEVNPFRNCAEFIKAIDSGVLDNPKRMQVLLLDIQMPVMGGFEFVDYLTKTKPEVLDHIQIFMLSANIDKEQIDQAAQYPCINKLLEKPLDSYQLKILVSSF